MAGLWCCHTVGSALEGRCLSPSHADCSAFLKLSSERESERDLSSGTFCMGTVPWLFDRIPGKTICSWHFVSYWAEQHLSHACHFFSILKSVLIQSLKFVNFLSQEYLCFLSISLLLLCYFSLSPFPLSPSHPSLFLAFFFPFIFWDRISICSLG